MSIDTSRSYQSAPDWREYAAREFEPGHYWEPYPWQIPPDDIDTHGLWLIEGGRGIGKTDGCSHYVLDHVDGPPCDERIEGGHRISIIAPTLGDAIESCCNGPSGLRAYRPEIRVRTSAGGTHAVWPNGVEARLFGAYNPEDVERLRAGGNRCLVWAEELATWRHLDSSYKHARHGLRIGPRPHIAGSSTPKPRPFYEALRDELKTIITHGETAQAHHLDPSVRDQLYADYGDTPLGEQELKGRLIRTVEGALWSRELLERNRVDDHRPRFWLRTIIALDPAAGMETGDEQGVAMVSQSAETHELYVRESAGYRIDVFDWIGVAIDLAIDCHKRDEPWPLIVWEDTGSEGAWIRKALEQIMAERGVMVPHQPVKAKDGKRLRAEPVAGLYHQGKVHHIGYFDKLETQMTSWTGLPKDRQPSPDRLDALVYACTQFIGHSLAPQVGGPTTAVPYRDTLDPAQHGGAVAYRWEEPAS